MQNTSRGLTQTTRICNCLNVQICVIGVHPRLISLQILERSPQRKSYARLNNNDNFAAQVSAVSSDADPDLVRTLSAEFTRSSENGTSANNEALLVQEIKLAIEFSAETIKSNLLKDLKKVQAEGAPALDAINYRAWLLSTKERYATWLAGL